MKTLMFKVMFFFGVVISFLSLFLLEANVAAFVVVFLIGANLMVFSMIKYKLAKKMVMTGAGKLKLSPVAMRINAMKKQETANKPQKPSFFKRLFAKKKTLMPQQKIDTSIAQKKVVVEPAKKSDVTVLKDQEMDEKTKMKIFRQYLLKAVKMGYPKDNVRGAALKSGWPADVFDKTYSEIVKKYSAMRKLLAYALVMVVLMLVYYLYSSDVLLFSYWIQLLKHASPIFFIGLIVLFFGISLVFILKIRVAVKMKSIEYRVAEQKTVSEIKTMLVSAKEGYQTDLDKLYQALEERGKININEIALIFGISKEQAEEWGKILKDQELATLHYPAVGEPELIWKKLKSIE